MVTTNDAKQLLSRQEVADILTVSTRTIARWERKGLLSPIRLSSRIIRYSREEVDALLAEATYPAH